MTARRRLYRERRELRAFMKAHGLRRVAPWNGGLSPEEYRCNARLFAISVALDKLKNESRSANEGRS